ncbi:MAG TPA: hypothetical protein VFM23_07905 [Gemmatimonadales bacterium]|nr:hypothetical protein [Gemmatimonadales bacterium]
MPPLARWYIKSAMIYLIAGLLVGAIPPALAIAGPTYVHLLVVGWITQMIFGVAYWMFPKYSAEAPRGGNAVAIATFILLNVGLVLRVVAEPLRAMHPESLPGWLLVVAGIAQAAAALGFALNTWPRVKVR